MTVPDYTVPDYIKVGRFVVTKLAASEIETWRAGVIKAIGHPTPFGYPPGDQSHLSSIHISNGWWCQARQYPPEHVFDTLEEAENFIARREAEIYKALFQQERERRLRDRELLFQQLQAIKSAVSAFNIPIPERPTYPPTETPPSS